MIYDVCDALCGSDTLRTVECVGCASQTNLFALRALQYTRSLLSGYTSLPKYKNGYGRPETTKPLMYAEIQ